VNTFLGEGTFIGFDVNTDVTSANQLRQFLHNHAINAGNIKSKLFNFIVPSAPNTFCLRPSLILEKKHAQILIDALKFY
jgi:hypothetical protein